MTNPLPMIITILKEEEGERLDKILAARFPDHSRAQFQQLIEQQKVLLNGLPVIKRIKPVTGDEIQVILEPLQPPSLTPEEIPLDILYEDEYLLVVNKPAGMVVHPAPGNWGGTFANALIHHCQDLQDEENPLRPGIVHRLDKDTSGVLLAAKNTKVHHALSRLFAQRRVSKEYIAICLGNPGSGEINAALGRHPVHRKKQAVLSSGGREAITRYETVAAKGGISLVRIQLLTGRTHQIRVHMQHRGCPLLGDALYGSVKQNEKWHAHRQLLHAHRLGFVHPFTGMALEVEAAYPEDMLHFINQILRR